jgi:hypothetical protein
MLSLTLVRIRLLLRVNPTYGGIVVEFLESHHRDYFENRGTAVARPLWLISIDALAIDLVGGCEGNEAMAVFGTLVPVPPPVTNPKLSDRLNFSDLDAS